MKTFLEITKQVLIPMFYKETQIGRSVRGNNLIFKKELFNAIVELSEKADNSKLRNMDIRKRIIEVSNKSSVSIGQAQKVINVYLKYYCILTHKPSSIIKELDCPLDGRIISKFKTKNLKKIALKDMNSLDDYIAWQNHLESVGNGVRLQPDIETYDKERIKSFLS